MINKSKKQLDCEYLQDRYEKIEEIESRYPAEKEEWDNLGLDSFPFDSLEEFVQKELVEWEQTRLKTPSGKYQDPKKVLSDYQQKFVHYTIELRPQVFEELQEFVPYFHNLFGGQKGKYSSVFSVYKKGIFDINTAFRNEISSLLVINNALKLKPDKSQNQRPKYEWCEYNLLFLFLYLLLVKDEEGEKRKEIISNLILLLQDKLITRPQIKLPENLDEIKLRNYFVGESFDVVKALLLDDKRKNFRDRITQKITKCLQDISPDNDWSVADFIKLQLGVLNWAQRHNFQKNWLLKYAYFFLDEFSSNRAVELKEIKVPHLYVRALYAFPFTFDFNGWFAGDEKMEDYQNRIIKNFETELQQYFHNVSVMFNLEGKKRARTVPFKNVEWLVYTVLLKWNAERILEKFFPDIRAFKGKDNKSTLEFEFKLKHIKSAMRKLKEFDLPVPKDL